MLIDTDTVDFTYTDATPELKADVKKQMSITSDSSGIKLSGDSASPGATKYYGTNSGSAKGWYSLADVIDAVMLALGTSMTNPDYVLGRKTTGGTTTYGWVATVTHASQHPENEE